MPEQAESSQHALPPGGAQTGSARRAVGQVGEELWLRVRCCRAEWTGGPRALWARTHREMEALPEELTVTPGTGWRRARRSPGRKGGCEAGEM